MRWDALIADLGGQLEAAEQAELAGEVADRSRRDVASVALLDRLRMAAGAELSVQLLGGRLMRGRVSRVGPDWLLLSVPGQPAALVPLAAVTAVSGLPALAADPASIGTVAARLDLAFVLRAIARDRTPLSVSLRDGSEATGTIDRVGADFLDLAEHPAGAPRRAAEVRGTRTVPFAGIAVVRPV